MNKRFKWPTKGLKDQLELVNKDSTKEYPKLTTEILKDYLLELSKSKKDVSKNKDIKSLFIEDLGNGLYKCGYIIFGKKGLEAIDKALKDKIDNYDKTN